MSVHNDELRNTYSRMSTDELLGRWFSGTLTDEAKTLALPELKSRGVDPEDPASVARYEEAEAAAAHEQTRASALDARGSFLEKLFLFALIAMIPVLGFAVGRYVEWKHENAWLSHVQRQLGERGAEAVRSGQLTLARYCASGEGQGDEACGTYDNIQLLQSVSIWSLVVGFGLLIAIVVAARLASKDRDLLVTLFSPGVSFVLAVLAALVVVQGGIATYAVFIFEETTIHRVHYLLIFVVGFGAIVGAVVIMTDAMSISRRAQALVIGRSISAEEQPRLWEFVATIARRLDAQPPKHIVVGLEPTFFVTSADVTLIPGPTQLHEETLYLSLPLMRVLSREELTAVVGHELGHFRGDDTKFSLKFYPIYAGITQALRAAHTARHARGGFGVAMLPAYAMLSLLLEEFAKAEGGLSRGRELEADRAGASVASARAVSTSLLKVGAFAELWPAIRAAMIETLAEGKALSNVCLLYAEAAASRIDPEWVDQVASTATAHPTDTHPPTVQRIEALGLSLAALREDALRIDSSECATQLLDDAEKLEEALTEIGRQALVELGQAKLPRASA